MSTSSGAKRLSRLERQRYARMTAETMAAELDRLDAIGDRRGAGRVLAGVTDAVLREYAAALPADPDFDAFLASCTVRELERIVVADTWPERFAPSPDAAASPDAPLSLPTEISPDGRFIR